jgi:hypothetical protein
MPAIKNWLKDANYILWLELNIPTLKNRHIISFLKIN